MEIFIRHNVEKIAGRYEVQLFVNKGMLVATKGLEDTTKTLKTDAIKYIREKFEILPVRIVRIMVGSIPYFSFALNKDKEPYNLSNV